MHILVERICGDHNKMKIKPTPLIILLLLVLSNGVAKNNLDYPYLVAMKNLASDNSTFMQIIYYGKHVELNNTIVNLFGYINKNDSRLYLSSDFNDPLQADDENYKYSWSILMFEDYQNKKLLDIGQCKGSENLVEIHGTFHVEKLPNEDPVYFFLTNITKVYEFDIKPLHKGGTGQKYQCYPEVDLKTSSLKE